MFALHQAAGRVVAFAVIVIGLNFACEARAQIERGSSWVQGSGAAVIERMPEVLRVQVQLSGRGKSLTEALSALRDRREAAKAVLPTLGATAESIKFDDPQVTQGEEQQKINQMLMDRMGRTKRGTKSETTLPTTATVNLTADWPLTAPDVEQLLAKVYELQEKIKAADLGGVKEAVKLSPEEEELQAEMAQMMSRGGSEGPAPGEPQFTYVAKVGADERAKLTAEAFQKAKADAERLATAAGAKIAKLVSLQSNAQSAGFDEGYSDYGGNSYYYEAQRRQMQMLRAGMGAAEPEAGAEAVGVRPAKVKYTVQVSAYFGLE